MKTRINEMQHIDISLSSDDLEALANGTILEKVYGDYLYFVSIELENTIKPGEVPKNIKLPGSYLR